MSAWSRLVNPRWGNNVLAATGHRPNKLGQFDNEKLEQMARNIIVERKPTACISGMALGWDTIWAFAAMAEKVPLVCAVPFATQPAGWDTEKQIQYEAILICAAHVEVVTPGPAAGWKYQVRNQWMVNNADRMIALWDGSKGGTNNCIRYAMGIGRPIVNLWETALDIARV